MKLNLCCGEDIIIGYVNIDRNPFNAQVQEGDFRNLSRLDIADGSVDEIRCVNVLRYNQLTALQGLLEHWKDKLSPGGVLVIQEIDARLLGNMLAHDQLNLEQINTLLYRGREPIISIYTLPAVEDLARQMGLIVLEKSVVGQSFILRLEKEREENL